MGELLLEIGVEEVPALLVRPTLDQLRERAAALFHRARLEAAELRTFGTPRRLVLTAQLPARQQAQSVEVTGPPAAAAYDAAGKPTAAAIGFAKSQGVAVESLRLVQTERGKYLAARKEEKALPTAKVLQQLLPELLGQLDFPKAMRWNTSGGQRFIRPIQWIVALLDRQVVLFTFAGVKSGARSYGHRELAPKAVTIRRSTEYVTHLRRACVLADDAARAGEISRLAQEHAAAMKAELLGADELIPQAVYSSEWPIVAAGEFDPAYLELPNALLLAVLQHQQSYFPVRRAGSLLPRFVCVIDGALARQPSGKRPPVLTAIMRDHERVLKARLEDARFYVKRDLALTLADRVETLKGVTFHEKLGTLYDKTLRVMELARWLAPLCGVDAKEAERAARLCKADLGTGLVREFPELQGAIGGEYAGRQGESAVVAEAIAQHYQPRATGDALPDSTLGQVLSLADKVDTLVGYFGVGLAPTGSEDPYGLRRQASGVVQIASEHPQLDLSLLVREANEKFKHLKSWSENNTRLSVMDFLRQRLEWQLLAEGVYRQDLVAAVVRPLTFRNPAKGKRWLIALQTILSTPAGDDLLTVYRRVGKIVPSGFDPVKPDPARFVHPEEKQLNEAFQERDSQEQNAHNLVAQNELMDLQMLARLRPIVDAFFAKVMVMDEDKAIRENRLRLVCGVKTLFNRIADFSKISTAPAAAQDTARVGGGREA